MKWNFLLWITAVLSLLYKCKFAFRRFFPEREVDHIKEKTQSNFCRFLIQRLSICQNVLCSYSGQLLLQLTQSVLSFHGFVLSSKLNSKGISDVNISIYKFSLVVRFCSFEWSRFHLNRHVSSLDCRQTKFQLLVLVGFYERCGLNLVIFLWIVVKNGFSLRTGCFLPSGDKWWELSRISIRGLLVDPIPKSPN